MDLSFMVEVILGAGADVVERCKGANQCEEEVAIIQEKTLGILHRLKEASKQFSEKDVRVQRSLLELTTLFDEATDVLIRCEKKKPSVGERLVRLRKGKGDQAKLKEYRVTLDRLANELGLPLTCNDKPQQNETNGHVDGEVGTLPGVKSGAHRESREENLGHVRYDLLVEPEEGTKVIGRGVFGVVVKGTYRGKPVAIKKAKGDLPMHPNVTEAWRREAITHFAIRHPNLVEVIAYSVGDAKHSPSLVMPLIEGSLYDHLADGHQYDFTEAFRISRDVTEGLNYLHQLNIVHHDLKSTNVLIDTDLRVMVSDFGVARVRGPMSLNIEETSPEKGKKQVNCEYWMSPEVYDGYKPTFSSDVFSLHVIMGEVFSSRLADRTTATCVRMSKEIGGVVPLNFPSKGPADQQVRTLHGRCGSLEPRQRPTTGEILAEMENIEKLPHTSGVRTRFFGLTGK